MINTISKNKIHNLLDKIKENKDLKIILKFCCKEGNSLLHILIDEEDTEGFKSLMCIIKEVRKTNKCLVKKIINMQNSAGDTPAHIAVRKSNNENNVFSMMVETLQSVGADLTISNNNNEVITQSGNPQYNEKQIEKQKYINNCDYNMDEMTQSDDNVSSEDLDNIETINSPLNHPFPFKLDILLLDQKQKYNQQPEYNFQEILQQKFQNQRQEYQQPEYNFQEILQQKLKQNQQPQYNFQEILQEKLEKQLQEQLQQRFRQKQFSYEGGGKSESKNEEITGKRKINNPYISNGGSKISEKNHNDAIEKIRKLGYSEEESKDVKNFLYYEIKDNFPDLNNDERSEKFAEVLKTFEMMDIKKVRKELEKYRERNNKNSAPKKEFQKEPKKESKKEPKKKSSKRASKRASKKTSKRASSTKKSSKRSYK
jgi:hypothetical protein